MERDRKQRERGVRLVFIASPAWPSRFLLILERARERERERARKRERERGVGGLLFVGCLTSQQQASVSQGRICLDNFTCYHTEIKVADQTFYLTQSQYTYIGPTSPSADPIAPGAWQGSHWSANV